VPLRPFNQKLRCAVSFVKSVNNNCPVICRRSAKSRSFFDKNDQKIKNAWNVAQKHIAPFWHIAQTNRLCAQKKSLKNVAQKQNNLLKNL